MSPDSPAPLRVLVLGPLRKQLGRDTVTLPFPTSGSQAGFWDEFFSEFPAAATGRLRLARGTEFLEPTALLQPGDEIALIPPVSGG